MADSPHILVVDDDARLRDLLARFLGSRDFRVTMAQDAADARARLQGLAFDAIVLDIMMPGEDGLSLLKWWRDQPTDPYAPRTPVLLLSAKGEVEDRVQGLELGAEDFLTKPFEPRELEARLKTLVRRYAPPTLSENPETATLRLSTCDVDLRSGQVRKGETLMSLPPAELKILRTLYEASGEPVSRWDLAELTKSGDSERAVDVHIVRLRRNLEVDAKAPAHILTVRGIGYRLLL